MKSALITLIGAAVIAAGVAFAVVSHQPMKAGAIGSPIDQSNYHCWAGVCEYFGSEAIKTATTTECAIQSPAASSTLGTMGVRIDVSSSTATTWMIGTGSTAFATTTALGGVMSVAGGKQAFIQGSTSPAAGSNTILGPNTWVIFQNNGGISSGDAAGTGFVPSGTCFVRFTAPQS